MTTKWILFSLALAAAGGFLAWEKATAVRLRTDLETHRRERADLETQRRERARLRALQPTADELARLQRTAVERAESRRRVEAAERERAESPAAGLAVGEWFPPAQWQDRGQGTPLATVQTMLWAATGGDTSRLETVLHFDDKVRAKLDSVFANLPANARANYANPEQLMAAFTAKSIPVGDAQLVWQQQTGPDEAVAFVWVDDPLPGASSSVPEKPAADPKAPPMLPANAKRSQALLMMRRFDDAWRVVVPLQAVDKLARELSAGK